MTQIFFLLTYITAFTNNQLDPKQSVFIMKICVPISNL